MGAASLERSRSRRAVVYVGVGLVVGLGYALLNTQTDTWARSELGRAFAAFHAFVDRGIPLLAGGLGGLAFHWLHLRTRLAKAEAQRADDLRSRLLHVERDQAAWVVAAATLHELKNPLHTLGLLVDELAHAVQSGDRRAAEAEVVRVRRQVERALVPLEGLRALTRRTESARAQIALAPAIAEIVDALGPIAADVGATLRVEAHEGAHVHVDPELLRIILDNLIANAIEGDEHGQRARTVLVSLLAGPGDDRVTVRVADDGPGLAASLTDEIFQPLRSEKATGLGLGLPIARALAQALGGDLALVSTPGFATTFALSLPRAAR